MELEKIILSEVTQNQKDKYEFVYMWTLAINSMISKSIGLLWLGIV